jgi:hypothetical protein
LRACPPAPGAHVILERSFLPQREIIEKTIDSHACNIKNLITVGAYGKGLVVPFVHMINIDLKYRR